jgi:hypothetical protein
LYDLSTDGKCLNINQFQCENKRCIDKSLICLDDDYCGDNSPRNNQCPKSRKLWDLIKFDFEFLGIGKQKLINWRSMFILMIFCCFVFVCILIICQKRRQNKDCVGGL